MMVPFVVVTVPIISRTSSSGLPAVMVAMEVSIHSSETRSKKKCFYTERKGLQQRTCVLIYTVASVLRFLFIIQVGR